MSKIFEEEFNYLIELSGKVLIGQVDAEKFEENRVAFFEKYNTVQQQALPVVPDYVAKWYEECAPIPVETCITDFLFNYQKEKSVENGTEFEQWFMRTDNSIEILMDMKRFGYRVEKPQLFYLKHIDMSKNDEQVDWYMSKAHRRVGHNACDKEKLPIYDSFKYTQQEIDSMQTGSYEQIEVAE